MKGPSEVFSELGNQVMPVFGAYAQAWFDTSEKSLDTEQ